jgi:hypothetical protein
VKWIESSAAGNVNMEEYDSPFSDTIVLRTVGCTSSYMGFGRNSDDKINIRHTETNISVLTNLKTKLHTLENGEICTEMTMSSFLNQSSDTRSKIEIQKSIFVDLLFFLPLKCKLFSTICLRQICSDS